MSPLISKLSGLLLKLVICVMVVNLTTYGWWPIFNRGQPDADESVVANLERSVKILSQDIGLRDYRHPENLGKAADFIRDSFESSGSTVSEQKYKVDGTVFRNIVAYCDNPGADSHKLVGRLVRAMRGGSNFPVRWTVAPSLMRWKN